MRVILEFATIVIVLAFLIALVFTVLIYGLDSILKKNKDYRYVIINNTGNVFGEYDTEQERDEVLKTLAREGWYFKAENRPVEGKITG